MGLNMNNVDPELLKFVDRKFEFSQARVPLRTEGARHPDDVAEYS